jgi:hypothetical protein
MTPWLWISTFHHLKLEKMILLEVSLMSRTTHLLLEHLLLTPTWQQTNQVRKFAGAPSFHTSMHAYTWVMWFTSIFSLFHAQ